MKAPEIIKYNFIDCDTIKALQDTLISLNDDK